MKLLIVSDMFSLDEWLIEGSEPEIMPAVYEFYNYMGNHPKHTFDAVIAHPKINKIVEFPNGSKIYIFKLNVPLHYLRKFISLSFLKLKAKKLISTGTTYTHIYGMTIYANVAKEIGESYKIPSVGRLFGSLIWDVLQNKKWLIAKTRFYYQLKEIQQPCDLTICTEDGTQFDKAIKKYSPKSIVYMMYNGINTNLRFKLLSIPVIDFIDSTKEIKFCYIARLTSWKRQDLALDIIKGLRDTGLKVSLDIYGKGETEKKLRSRIHELRLDTDVSIKGSVPHIDIASTLAQYHAAMFLYDASNLGNAIWEASLAGRLIITRDTGKTLNIYNNDNAVIMKGENVDNLINDFISILNKKINLSLNSRTLVNDLLPSWDQRMQSEMNLIESMERL